MDYNIVNKTLWKSFTNESFVDELQESCKCHQVCFLTDHPLTLSRRLIVFGAKPSECTHCLINNRIPSLQCACLIRIKLLKP